MFLSHEFVAVPGKRRNVLQNRTDSWDYDMDQLLLGTILFTLLAFLSPTVGVYYALFALVGILNMESALQRWQCGKIMPTYRTRRCPLPMCRTDSSCRYSDACDVGDGASFHEPFPIICRHA
jgi:hypothetical protein